jgi:hypothetical protein
MANLRGAKIDKQLKDAFYRLANFGISRYQSDSKNLTHSLGLAKKRETELKQFGTFLKNEHFTGKVNEVITEKMMEKFFDQRLQNLQNSTKETVIRTWSSLVQGLQSKNIDIVLEKNYFDEKIERLREEGNIRKIKTNQAITNIQQIINKIYDIRYETGVYSETMYQLGIRSSEAIELIKNPSEYITVHNGKYEVCHLIGKGNHQYNFKIISVSLVNKIEQIKKIPSKSTLHRDLKSVGINSHQLRYTFAKEHTEKLYKYGLEHKKVLKEVSKELNHKRGEMTNYYLRRA